MTLGFSMLDLEYFIIKYFVSFTKMLEAKRLCKA